MKVIGENEVKIQLKESTGPMGPAGPKGDKGDKGDRGETGPRGLTGEMGPKGDKGDKGERGEMGATGATGPQGPQGETGPSGPQGPKGEKGETGAAGPQGPQGIQGEAGPQGEQGPQGEKGEKGDKGDTGPQGPAGSIDNLPIASLTQLGGVQPVAKTDEMTQAVGVDEAGGLWALPGGGSGGWEYIGESTPESQLFFETGKYKEFYALAWFERETTMNDFMRLWIDKIECMMWLFSADASASVAILINPMITIGEYKTGYTEYIDHLTRGSTFILKPGSEDWSDTSLGTVFWKTNSNHDPTNFGIKLWGRT